MSDNSASVLSTGVKQKRVSSSDGRNEISKKHGRKVKNVERMDEDDNGVSDPSDVSYILEPDQI